MFYKCESTESESDSEIGVDLPIFEKADLFDFYLKFDISKSFSIDFWTVSHRFECSESKFGYKIDL